MKRAIFCFFLCLFSFTTLEAATGREIVKKKGTSLLIGLVTALPGESGKLLESMQGPIVSTEKAMRTFHKGKLHGIDTVLVSSRVGKVAAAATIAQLILEYKVDIVVFTGVAGAVDPELNVGDIVIANALIQHDVDARPFCERFVIPLLRIKECLPDPFLQKLAFQAGNLCVTKDLTKTIPSNIAKEFQISKPKVTEGLVLSGDQVISQESQKVALKKMLPNALCVEMEGASIAQICYEYGVPCVIIRTISDYANHEKAHVDIKKFVSQVAGYYSEAMIKNLYTLIRINNE